MKLLAALSSSLSHHKPAGLWLPYSRLVSAVIGLALLIWFIIDAQVAAAVTLPGGAS